MNSSNNATLTTTEIKIVPLRSLLYGAHPKIPGKSLFPVQVMRWVCGEKGLIVNRRPEGDSPLMYVVNDLPDSFLRRISAKQISEATFVKTGVSLSAFWKWQRFDVVKCYYNQKFAFWLVNPKHKELLEQIGEK